MRATFHERQYELALNLELILGSNAFFAPMQVIEENVGYDIALVPGQTAVWRRLGVGEPPTGVETPVEYDTNLNPVAGGRSFVASLFIQHKRPERMVRTTASESTARRSAGGGVPFFRVKLDDDQHGVLLDLEARVAGDAVVRYAAPLFHLIEDLWARQAKREVLEGSTFIPPSAAGDPPSRWTYDGSGAAIFCSAPRSGERERRVDLMRSIVRIARVSPSRTVAAHLRSLSLQVEEIDLSPDRSRGQRRDDDSYGAERGFIQPAPTRAQWEDRLLDAAPQLEDDERSRLVDAAIVANAAAAIGLTWLIADVRQSGDKQH